ncbi:hypothetical protein ACFE04_009927 [Oxalis oulophora]
MSTESMKKNDVVERDTELPIFQRYPRPEKEYQSFSLICKDESLDLICKDREEAEIWFTGLKALITRVHHQKGRSELKREGVSSEASSPKSHTRRSSPLSSPFSGSSSSQKDELDPLGLHTPNGSPPKLGLERALSDVISYAPPPKVLLPSESMSSGGSDGITGRTKGIDPFRVSWSSAISSSSQGSGHYESDALGDVYIWGEGTGDGFLGGGIHKIEDSFGNDMDSLVPKPVDSAVVLDVQNIACGSQHAAFVTKQGEVFSWGEEFGGRLGHGVDSDVSHPKLIDALKNISIEFIACGEYHSYAVSLGGDLYSWGSSGENRWIPKKLIGQLEGIHVCSVSCGPWHTTVITSAGQLFTFGDGTFGVLGHGDRKSISTPREVESLKGLRTVRVACGFWHTAAVVEVVSGSSRSSSSGKLFTWGDGDKNRLGHGDKEAKLIPTCVASLVDSNFCQVACGQSLTVALTVTGQVYTMGSPVYGQLGHTQAHGEIPTRVEGKLMKNFVEEISCGGYHVAVLTSKTEVYTWGKGANGRLGHGDTKDRTLPSFIEALRDKQVKSIVCGSNFTAALCLHKWVSGIDQSMCSSCRLPFTFSKKRHNCYNCGLVFCNSCSHNKSLKASMAPAANKLYRVCDNCYAKLRKAPDSSSLSRSMRDSMNQSEKLDLISVSSKRNKKLDFKSARVLPLPNGASQNNNFKSSNNAMYGSTKKFFSASLPGSRIASRATSPNSRRSSPPRAATPMSGCVDPKIIVVDSKTRDDSLSEEANKLKAQVEKLTHKTQIQEVELEKITVQLKEAIDLAEKETSKCKAAKEVIKSLTSQLKDVAERLPVGSSRINNSIPPFHSGPTQYDISTVASEQWSNSSTCHELNSVGSNSLIVSTQSGSNSNNNSSNHMETVHLESNTKSKNRQAKVEAAEGDEWVEQDETGVYITLVALPGGAKDLKRVRFNRKRFSEKQAEQWWAANRTRLYQQYNIPTVDKSSDGKKD